MKEKDAFFPIYFFFNGSKDLKGFSKYLTYESTILIFVVLNLWYYFCLLENIFPSYFNE